MTLVLVGALLVLAGVVFMAGQPLWHGRLSGRRRLRSTESSGTFGLKSNWPGLALVALGAVLLLAGAAF